MPGKTTLGTHLIISIVHPYITHSRNLGDQQTSDTIETPTWILLARPMPPSSTAVASGTSSSSTAAGEAAGTPDATRASSLPYGTIVAITTGPLSSFEAEAAAPTSSSVAAAAATEFSSLSLVSSFSGTGSGAAYGGMRVSIFRICIYVCACTYVLYRYVYACAHSCVCVCVCLCLFLFLLCVYVQPSPVGSREQLPRPEVEKVQQPLRRGECGPAQTQIARMKHIQTLT